MLPHWCTSSPARHLNILLSCLCLKAWKLSHLFSKALGITRLGVFELSYRLSFHFSRSDSDLSGATRTVCCSRLAETEPVHAWENRIKPTKTAFGSWFPADACTQPWFFHFPSAQREGKKKWNENGKSQKTSPPPNSPYGLSVRFKALILYLHRKEDIELLTPIAQGQGGSVKHQRTDRVSLNTDCIPVALLLEGSICTTRITAADPRSSPQGPVPGQSPARCSPASASGDSRKAWGQPGLPSSFKTVPG